MILSASNPPSVDEDDYISDGSVERCVEYEEAQVVARGERTHIADWEKFYSLPGEGEAVLCAAIFPEPPETRGQRGQYREYWNHNIEDRELSRFHTKALTLQSLGQVFSCASEVIFIFTPRSASRLRTNRKSLSS